MNRLLQFTLDLFERDPTPAAPSGPVKRRAAPPRRPKAAPTPDPQLFEPPRPKAPTPSPAGPPAAPLTEVIAPMSFRHPQANRELQLQGTWVAYRFERARRRSIGFVVGPEGLVVRAPRWVPQAEVDAALRTKSAWIVRKLDEARERQTRQAEASVAWADGAELPFLGEPLRVRLQPGALAGGLLHSLPPEAAAEQGVRHLLSLGLPPQAEASQIKDAVQACLMREAKALFAQRLDHYAPQLGVQWKKLALSNASTRWGSARIDGSIRLNWRLIHFSLPVIDYVVVHELAHLRVMDHSPRFWDTVAAVVPDHAERRQQLRLGALPRW
ncbi:M48 family metallopeptidase [Curvibacter gracilis]|uniref:M48 family metallopeptidase n=1 Tax=Curvibacter gracilis TaxID=230310 RepID=UPI00047F9862|nr:SprT family zinc-dependent metalloprotease [Curvibacter gracilis]